MHDENVLEGMAHCAEKSKKFRFIRKTEELDKFCEVALKKCEKCGRFHHDILYHGYSLLSPDFSQQVKQKVESSLQRSADFNLYYKSSIKGIINYDLFFDQYLCLFKFTKPDDEHLFLHMDGELFYRNLNNMINLAFKNNRTLPASFISSLKGMSDYYDWILDMEHFEYGKFKPLWILQYPTKYYLQKAFSIKDVRTRTQAYLRKNYQPTLANYAVAYI